MHAIFCDNHQSNVSTFKKLLAICNQNPNDLCMNYQWKETYLFYESVNLIKNIRNNLLNCKGFIFRSCTFYGFRYIIDLQSGKISWKIFHNIFEDDETLDFNLKKNTKIGYEGKVC